MRMFPWLGSSSILSDSLQQTSGVRVYMRVSIFD